MASTSSTSGLILSSTISDYMDKIKDYVSSYKDSISKPLTTLNTKKDTYTKQKTAVNNIKTKLSSLSSVLSDLKATGSLSKFNSNTVTSSDESVLTVTSTGISYAGNYLINVKQIAKYDKVLSGSIIGTDKNSFSNGTQNLKITVGDSEYDVKIDVSEEDTNLSALRNIMNTINSSDAGTKVKATIIQDTDNTYRLVLTSKETGSKNAIQIKGSNNLLNDLSLNNENDRELINGNNGGYLYSSIDELNAIFTVDGIQMTRQTNKISDVISGVTFELKQAQSSDKYVNINITQDKSNVKALVDNFISKYNETINFLNQKVAVSTTGTKSELTGDTTIIDLRQKLRSLVVGKIDGLNTDIDSLVDIGIVINSDGTLTLKDTNKFNSVLENDVNYIANIFNSENGIATKLSSYINTYVKTNGILDNKVSNIDAQIKSIESKITTTTEQINKKTEKVQEEYEKLLNTMIQLNYQQSLISQITSTYNVSY
ncbi:MAG TPA: flagellar filament capping protein FliD [Bacteroidota bacterium]|jgi:flagellar hook-associated protein 2|nr:flagellar filament capping protein FliD [Bacteroidota bacterium]